MGLTHNILIDILSMLTSREYYTLLTVSEDFYLACTSDYIWYKITKNRFGGTEKVKDSWLASYDYYKRHSNVYQVNKCIQTFSESSEKSFFFGSLDSARNWIKEDIVNHCLLTLINFDEGKRYSVHSESHYYTHILRHIVARKQSLIRLKDACNGKPLEKVKVNPLIRVICDDIRSSIVWSSKLRKANHYIEYSDKEIYQVSFGIYYMVELQPFKITKF